MKNELNKFSLISLVENLNEVELNEVQPAAAEDALATFRNIGKGTKAAQQVAQDIVATMSRGGAAGEAIHIIGKGNNLVPAKNGGELLNALKAGTIDAVNLARVNKGILKSAAVKDVNILRNIASDVVYEANFIKKYGVEYLGKGEDAARKLLQDNGYTRNAIDEMIKKMKADANYGKNVAGLDKEIAKLKSQNKTLRGKIKKQNQQGQPVELQAKTNGEIVQPKPDGSVVVTEPPVAGGTPPAPVPVPPNKVKEFIDGIRNKKWDWKKILAWGAGIGLGATALWWLVTKLVDTVPDGMPTVEPTPEIGGDWAPCLRELLKNKEAQIAKSDKGAVSVLVKNDEYPGGIQFFNNGRVMDIANNKMGSWKCKGGQAVIKESQKITLIGILNEQVEDEMASDVENMIDLLDFPVTQNNLINAGKLMKKYVDNGKGKEFLSLYQQSGLGGGSMNKTLKNIVTVNAKSVQAKNYLSSLVNQIEGGGTGATPSPEQGKKIGLSNIEITWDGSKKTDDGGTPTPKKPKYEDCSGKPLPHQFGCRSEQIKQVQVCLDLPIKYQTGNFGPITKKALEDKGIDISKGITEDLIKSVCGDNVPDVKLKKLSTDIIRTDRPNIKTGTTDISKLKIKAPEITTTAPDGKQIYDALRNNFESKDMPYIFSQGDRLKYKGDGLSQEILDALSEYVSTLGYGFMKQKPKEDYEMKYVWEKQ